MLQVHYKISRQVVTLTLVFLGIISLSNAHAAELSGKVINQWISSQQALHSWGEKYEDDIRRIQGNSIPTSPAEMVAPLKQLGIYSEVEGILEDHGFNSPESWADTSLRIMRAYGAIQMENNPEMAQMSAQMAEIENNPNISAEQKAMMKEMMGQATKMMEEMQKAPKADIDAIRPHLSAIEQVMQE